MSKPLCFVLMPFGTKPGPSGRTIDFDAVYRDLLRPAIERAGMEPVRADEEVAGGIIHKPMFERLLLCDYAVADLTTANANVFYELGVRHAVRPRTTVLVSAQGERLPFDVALDRGDRYVLTDAGTPAASEETIGAIAARLEAAKEPMTDSPIYQLIADWPELSADRTDVFRHQVQEQEAVKGALARARDAGPDDVRAVAAGIDVANADAELLVELLLAYRAVSAWADMVALAEAMPAHVATQTLVREQYAMALNRAGRRKEAETVLTELIRARGASPETCGILGRVHKDRANDADKAGKAAEARGYRRKAIDAYLQGFEADWRDHYPGINAVQLIHAENPADPRLAELVPVVTYSVRRKVARGAADYWDHATLLELAVLAGDQAAADAALGDALAATDEEWMFETTAATLQGIIARGGPAWVADVEAALGERAREGGGDA